MNILGILPARKGSKGLINKNTRDLCGRPMLYYSIKEAKESTYINKLIVSTNDPKVKEISDQYDVEVINQPEELSQDNSPTFPIIPFVISQLRKVGYYPDIVVLMRITTPLKKAYDIDSCIAKLIETKASSVISVVELIAVHPLRMKIITADDFLIPYNEDEGDIPLQRQKLSKVFIRNGAVYAATIETINNGGLFGKTSRPYIMPADRSVNINQEIEFLLAETLLKAKSKVHN